MPYRYNAITGELDLVGGSSSSGAITQINTDSGSVTPIAGVVGLAGDNGISTSGASNVATISSTGFITPYVVSQDNDTDYSTIQSALTAANAAGGGIVYVRPGTYTENLTLYGDTEIVGTPGNSDAGTAGNTTVIVGIHTPPLADSFTFANVRLESATHIFSSVAAGSCALVLINVFIDITSGYLFNLPNWTGTFVTYNLGEGSTDNGMVNNTAGATCFFISATHGAGTGQAMVTSGTTILQEVDLNCPWQPTTGTDFTCDYLIATKTITLLNNSTGSFNHSRFSTGATAALTMSSSATVNLNNCIIDSSTNPCIGGSGAGTLNLQDVTFLDNTSVAGTLTTGTAGGFYPSGSLGSTGDVWTSNGPGAVPTFQTPSSNASYMVTALTTASTPYTVLSTDQYLSCNVSGGVLTVRLPNAPTTGRVVIVKDVGGNSATNNITVTTVGGAVNIDGATTFVMNTAYEAASFIFNGSTWEIF